MALPRTKEEIIKKFGKNDGHNELRWQTAVHQAGILDRHVAFVFEDLIKLEDRGLIEVRTLNEDDERLEKILTK